MKTRPAKIFICIIIVVCFLILVDVIFAILRNNIGNGIIENVYWGKGGSTVSFIDENGIVNTNLFFLTSREYSVGQFVQYKSGFIINYIDALIPSIMVFLASVIVFCVVLLFISRKYRKE